MKQLVNILEAWLIFPFKHLNLLDCTSTIIEVEKNICRFIPAKIEIADQKFDSFSLRFGDIFPLDPPRNDHGDLSFSNFSNAGDYNRASQVMIDEGFSMPSVSFKGNFVILTLLLRMFICRI